MTREVSILSLYSLRLDLDTGELVIQPVHIFVASPPGYSLDQLQTLDLPLYRQVKVTKEMRGNHLVVSLPYVGEVAKIGPEQKIVMEITQSTNGFVVRGNVSPVTMLLLFTLLIQYSNGPFLKAELMAYHLMVLGQAMSKQDNNVLVRC